MRRAGDGISDETQIRLTLRVTVGLLVSVIFATAAAAGWATSMQKGQDALLESARRLDERQDRLEARQERFEQVLGIRSASITSLLRNSHDQDLTR